MPTRNRDDQDTLNRLLEEIQASRDAILASEERIRTATDLLVDLVEQRELERVGVPALMPDLIGETVEPPPAAPVMVTPAGGEEDYLHVISHDLKEPLRGITYFSQLLSEDYADRLDGEGREHLDYILAATKRMNRLLEDVLTLSRLQRRPLNITRTDLETLVRGVIEELKGLMKEKRASIEIKHRLPTLACDQSRIRELLWHLLRNALMYSEAPAHIEIDAEGPRDGFYYFRMKDQGMGIEPQFQEQIFGLFQRLHSWEVYEGTGAGLTISRKIVTLHGGKIWVSSTAGRGATFNFTLPAERLEPEELVE